MSASTLRRFALCTVLLALTACGATTPRALLEASRLDPLNTRPDAIAIALGVPSVLRLSDGDATFLIALQDEAGAVLARATAPLQLRPGLADAPPPNAAGETVYVGRFAPADARRIAETQAVIRRLRAEGAGGTGTIRIAVVGGCWTGTPSATLPTSTWLRTGPERAFVPVTDRVRVADLLGSAEARILLASFAPCGG